MINMISNTDLIEISKFGERDQFDYIAMAKELGSMEIGHTSSAIKMIKVLISFTDYATRNDIIDRFDLAELNDLVWTLISAWEKGYETYRIEHNLRL